MESSIGIIGGADGSTAVFVTTSAIDIWPVVFTVIAVIVCIAVGVIICKQNK